MKTKNKPSILELTGSIFLCLDLPDFLYLGEVFFYKIFFVFLSFLKNFRTKMARFCILFFPENTKIYKNFVLNFDV
tara:strand:- start:51 stop:278 length:228 start_codon:yes stop_codon:yes gene_type:complete